ncbi:MAG: FecR domain-containing protein [Moraxellaceae bacterium]|nr:FecR domain-containing protein [Moraxellaceae bacterium]
MATSTSGPAPTLLPDGLLDTAVTWLVRLESGAATQAEHSACAAWRQADPLHERAWQQVRAIDDSLRLPGSLPAHLAYRTLHAASDARQQSTSRRRALKLLGLGALGLAVGAAIAPQAPWLLRETHTSAVGQRRQWLLSDGTRLQLNTDSAVEVVFSPRQRLIILQRGEIHIDTGADKASLLGRRKFYVQTAQAQLEALGTRFTVRQDADTTTLHVIQDAVAVHRPAEGATDGTIVRAGETMRIASGGAHAVQAIAPALDPSAWAEGVLVAKQMRLDAFVAELARYRHGRLDCDPAVAGLLVSGVFQLAHVDPARHALEALSRSLPIRVRSAGDDSLRVSPR